MTDSLVTLYAVPHSLYAGRARSYLIKAGIAYREQAPHTAHFHGVVKPRAGGRNSLPTVEFTDGTVIRDGAAIIEHFEAGSGWPFTPHTPKQNMVSLLFDVIGAEGLLRPAMHYRWNFDAENLDFLIYHFEMITSFGDKGPERARLLADRMKNLATPSFGVVSETIATVEAVYADQLAALNRHFGKQGYLLGGQPCIGDFGMIAPLFAHLGRDPKPLALMQKDAKHVYRWVERMNRTAADLCEFERQDETWVEGDQIPDTLVDVLKAMAEDFVPETLAAATTINQWLSEQEALASGTECARGVGMSSFTLRGTEISSLAQPYRFYLLQKLQDAYAGLEGRAKSDMDALLAACGMSELINATLTRRIGRENNLEIWL